MVRYFQKDYTYFSPPGIFRLTLVAPPIYLLPVTRHIKQKKAIFLCENSVFRSLDWRNLELFSQRFETVSEFLWVETSNFYGLIFHRL